MRKARELESERSITCARLVKCVMGAHVSKYSNLIGVAYNVPPVEVSG